MSDNLISRVKRLVSGGVNNIVDAVENSTPETVMKEAIREVDSAIDQVRHELGEVIAAKHLANQRLMETNSKHEDLTGKVNVAVQEGRDDLAEAAIGRQIDLESQIPVIENAIRDAGAQEVELEQYIAALQARRREMEEELRSFEAAQKAANGNINGQNNGRPNNNTERSVENAENAFGRVMSSKSGIPGADPVERDTASKLAELEKISRENRVHERLAAIKANSV